jgi:ABC-type Fe3+-hydroxamate transport system substrate-binding protein
VINAKPDIILDFGTVSPTFVSLAERVQQQTGIPYLLFDGRLDNTARSVRGIGAVLGVEPRAELIARYIEETEKLLDARLKDIPDITASTGFYAAFATSSEWAAVPAVANHRVYLALRLPFGWIDDPPSVNRAVGMLDGARMLAGPNFARTLPAAMLLGSAFMLAVDTLARTMARVETPIGILTAVVGAPFFLSLLARGRRTWG